MEDDLDDVGFKQMNMLTFDLHPFDFAIYSYSFFIYIARKFLKLLMLQLVTRPTKGCFSRLQITSHFTLKFENTIKENTFPDFVQNVFSQKCPKHVLKFFGKY